MKKMMLALVLTLVGLGLTTDAVARRCGKSCNVGCERQCGSKCGSECGGCVTYSESGKPCCIKKYICEKEFPADKHVHTTYTCPSECQEMEGDYVCQTDLQEIH